MSEKVTYIDPTPETMSVVADRSYRRILEEMSLPQELVFTSPKVALVQSPTARPMEGFPCIRLCGKVGGQMPSYICASCWHDYCQKLASSHDYVENHDLSQGNYD